MNRRIVILSLALIVGLLGPARADMVLDIPFGEADTPLGTLTAQFQNLATDTVRLTLTGNLVGTEFIDGEDLQFGWGFNIDPDLDLTGFNPGTDISWVSSTTGSPTTGLWDFGLNEFKADGDGYFDLMIVFLSDKFDDSDQAVYDITWSGLTAQSFYFFSSGGGDQGTYLSAAHVQGTTGPEGSGWIGAVPAPGAVLLGVIGLGMVGWVKRRVA